MMNWTRDYWFEVVMGFVLIALFVIGVVLVDGPQEQFTVAAQDTETPLTFPVVTIAASDLQTVSPAVLVKSGAATSLPQRLDSFQATPTIDPLWSGPIPAYRPGGACTIERATVITDVFRAAGASTDTQIWALTVASRESNCDNTAHNYNTRTRDDSYGWCQLNARSGHFGSNGVLAGWDRNRLLTDFGYNTEACVAMWAVCGRGPWSPPYSCRVPTS